MPSAISMTVVSMSESRLWPRGDLLIGGGGQGGDHLGVDMRQLAPHQAAHERFVPGGCAADGGPTGRGWGQGHVRAVVLHRYATHHLVSEVPGRVNLQDLLDARRAPTVAEPLDRALLRRAGGRWAVATVVPGAPVGIAVRVGHEGPHDLRSGSGRPLGFHRQLTHLAWLLSVPPGTCTIWYG